MKRISEFTCRAFLLVVLCAVLSCSRSCSGSSVRSMGPVSSPDSIPAVVLQESLRYVASRMGAQFRRDSVRFDRARSLAHPILPPDFVRLHPDLASLPWFRMCFRFSVPESPWVDGNMEFFVDGRGHLLPDTHVDGIPDCVHQPSECVFPIDEAEAFRLAKEAGLEEGLRPWKASFHWLRVGDKDLISGTYVWDVSNTRDVSLTREGGDAIVIDANSGKVVYAHMGWGALFSR
ncbi:MAG: hypothetical protein NTX17_00050 [Candidatus Eisenbacteria bacterium]|nr:hypothetical protein [Candidatus Eisenbacteria bacterium]